MSETMTAEPTDQVAPPADTPSVDAPAEPSGENAAPADQSPLGALVSVLVDPRDEEIARLKAENAALREEAADARTDRDSLSRAQQLAAVVADSFNEWEETKKAAAEKKKEYDEEVLRLRAFLAESQRKARAEKEKCPLFDPPEAPAADEAPYKPAEPTPDEDPAAEPEVDLSYRKDPIGVLKLSMSILGKLAEGGIGSIGDLQDWTESGKKLTDIKGIGEAAAGKIHEALEAYWAAKANDLVATAIRETIAEDEAAQKWRDTSIDDLGLSDVTLDALRSRDLRLAGPLVAMGEEKLSRILDAGQFDDLMEGLKRLRHRLSNAAIEDFDAQTPPSEGESGEAIANLGLSSEIRVKLSRADIDTIDELVRFSGTCEFGEIEDVTPGEAEEIARALEAHVAAKGQASESTAPDRQKRTMTPKQFDVFEADGTWIGRVHATTTEEAADAAKVDLPDAVGDLDYRPATAKHSQDARNADMPRPKPKKRKGAKATSAEARA